MTTRTLSPVRNALALAAAFALAGCPLADDESLSFGKACSDTCADGFFCDKARGVCLPGAPPPLPVIDAFELSATDVRPDEDVSITWASSDAVSCALDANGPVPDLDVAGTFTVRFATPGDVAVELSCTGGGGDVDVESATIHVRVVAPSLALATQDDVDASANIEEVDGDVTITEGVADTSPLSLRIVHGDLQVFDLTALVDLTLAALERVDGDVIVRSNDTLESAQLDELENVGGDLLVTAQPLLNNTTGGPTLGSFSALLLENVGGAVALSAYEYEDADGDGLADNLEVYADNTLASLVDVNLASLKTVGGSFRVESAPVSSLALPAIESIGGAVVFYGCGALTEIDWPVRSLGGGAVFESNTALTRVSFPQLTTMGRTRELIGDVYERTYEDILQCSPDRYEVGDLFFLGNDSDGNPCGDGFDNDVIVALELPALRTVEGRLLLVGLGIHSLSLPTLENAGGLVIHRNGVLTSVDIPALTVVGAAGLALDGGDTVSGLSSLATVEGDLRLDAAALPTFTSLTTVGGTLDLGDLRQEELTRLPALAAVDRLVLDADDPQRSGTIATLALPSLTTVGTLDLSGVSLTGVELCGLATAGTLRIAGTGITTLDGLASLTDVTTLNIDNNAGLAECLVDALAAQTTPTTDTSTGNTGTAPPVCAMGTAICG